MSSLSVLKQLMLRARPTKYEQAHKTAQENATKTLGLPPNNTAMDRAKAMGFDTKVYHGTNSDIKMADYAHSGKGNDQYGSAALYTGSNPHIANTYVKNDISGGNVMPLLVNTKGFIPHDKVGQLSQSQIKALIKSSPDESALSNYGDVDYEGYNKVLNNAVNSYKGIGNDELLPQMTMINNDFYRGSPGEFNKNVSDLTGINGVTVDVGGGNNFQLPYKPNAIRSRFAAFDPARAHEADMLGMATPAAMAATAGTSAATIAALRNQNKFANTVMSWLPIVGQAQAAEATVNALQDKQYKQAIIEAIGMLP